MLPLCFHWRTRRSEENRSPSSCFWFGFTSDHCAFQHPIGSFSLWVIYMFHFFALEFLTVFKVFDLFFAWSEWWLLRNWSDLDIYSYCWWNFDPLFSLNVLDWIISDVSMLTLVKLILIKRMIHKIYVINWIDSLLFDLYY